MRLIAPNGVRLSVSDAKGERLQREGYKVPEAAVEAAPVPSSAPAKRTRRKPKTKETPEDGVRNA